LPVQYSSPYYMTCFTVQCDIACYSKKKRGLKILMII